MLASLVRVSDKSAHYALCKLTGAECCQQQPNEWRSRHAFRLGAYQHAIEMWLEQWIGCLGVYSWPAGYQTAKRNSQRKIDRRMVPGWRESTPFTASGLAVSIEPNYGGWRLVFSFHGEVTWQICPGCCPTSLLFRGSTGDDGTPPQRGFDLR